MAETIGSFAALGDSFTEGLNDRRPDGGFLGWADRAAEALAAQNPDFRYANLAVRGKLVHHVLEEQVELAITMSPDLVSVAAGGNDILRRADVDNLAELFDSGVAKLRAAGCRVMIFTGFEGGAGLKAIRAALATMMMRSALRAPDRPP